METYTTNGMLWPQRTTSQRLAKNEAEDAVIRELFASGTDLQDCRPLDNAQEIRMAFAAELAEQTPEQFAELTEELATRLFGERESLPSELQSHKMKARMIEAAAEDAADGRSDADKISAEHLKRRRRRNGGR